MTLQYSTVQYNYIYTIYIHAYICVHIHSGQWTLNVLKMSRMGLEKEIRNLLSLILWIKDNPSGKVPPLSCTILIELVCWKRKKAYSSALLSRVKCLALG